MLPNPRDANRDDDFWPDMARLALGFGLIVGAAFLIVAIIARLIGNGIASGWLLA